MKFTKTNRTTVKRTAKRAHYDKDLFNQIVDQVKIGHLAFHHAGDTHSIPMPVCRHQDYLYFHCSVESRLAALATMEQDICISFAIIDELVFAKSAFRHSVNYRSAVIYGQCQSVQVIFPRFSGHQNSINHAAYSTSQGA